MMKYPPGRRIRWISSSDASGSATCSRGSDERTASNPPVEKGSRIRSDTYSGSRPTQSHRVWGAPTGLDVEGDHGEPAAFQQKCHLTKPAPPVQDPPFAHNRCNLVRLPAVPLNAGAIVKMMDQAAFLMPDSSREIQDDLHFVSCHGLAKQSAVFPTGSASRRGRPPLCRDARPRPPVL